MKKAVRKTPVKSPSIKAKRQKPLSWRERRFIHEIENLLLVGIEKNIAKRNGLQKKQIESPINPKRLKPIVIYPDLGREGKANALFVDEKTERLFICTMRSRRDEAPAKGLKAVGLKEALMWISTTEQLTDFACPVNTHLILDIAAKHLN